MAEYQLKNQELTLKISSKGAEMKSLKDNKTNQEYLWHGTSLKVFRHKVFLPVLLSASLKHLPILQEK